MSAGTFSQIYIHIVFAVKCRRSLIHATWEDRLYQYITGVVRNKGQKMLAINGMEDHIHLLIGMKPSICLSDLVREIKKSSNIFINENRLSPSGFSWQEGFGAFSYGHSQLNIGIGYVMNQKMHHKKKKFKEEYEEMLLEFNIEHDKRYLFEWLD